MREIIQRITELERRLANMLLIGVISDVDYERSLVQVTVGELITGWLPWLTRRAGKDIDYWAPEVGEQVLVMSPYGDPALGVVLPALYRELSPAPDQRATVHRRTYANGAVVEYDREANHLKAVLPESGTTELISQGGIEITGNTKINGELHVTDNTTIDTELQVKGNIKGDKDITDKTRSMAADRGIYNSHVHPGVKPGPATTGTTGAAQ